MTGARWAGYLDASNGLCRPNRWPPEERVAYRDGWQWWHDCNG